jgi:hypothetical protein
MKRFGKEKGGHSDFSVMSSSLGFEPVKYPFSFPSMTVARSWVG